VEARFEIKSWARRIFLLKSLKKFLLVIWYIRNANENPKEFFVIWNDWRKISITFFCWLFCYFFLILCLWWEYLN
jgi:hypothetical protein